MSVFSRALSTLRHEGVVSTAWRVGKWMSSRSNPFAEKPLQSVFREDVIAADWTRPRKFAAQALVSSTGRPQIAWVISPPGRSSGGHQNAFRFMHYLEEAGYDLTIFLYSATTYPKVSVAGVTHMLAGNAGYQPLDASFEIYDPATGVVGDFDAVVASDWATAYAAWRYERNVPRLYWVQDFEPSFFPQSPDYVVAENSYRLGLHGITVGPWLANKLRRDYGMACDSYEYAADAAVYQRTNDEKRTEIGFYARPSTGRRGTEFGLLVLEELHRRRPDITINIAGWDMSKAGLTFPFVNHGTLSVADLPPLYNRCAAMLTISLTCASLVPFENIACGTIPVVNDGENTRESLRDDTRIAFVPLSVGAMVDALIEAVDRPDQVNHSRALATSMVGSSWSEAGDVVVDVFSKQLKLKKRG